MKIRSISHVGLTVSNFEKAVKWYDEMFGLKLITEKTMEKEQVESLYSLYKLTGTSLRLGFLRAPKGVVVEIFEFIPSLTAEHPIWNKPGPTHITFDVKAVNRWYNILKAKGVEFCSEPQSTDGTDWVFLKDPDGNLIELIDLKYNYLFNRLFGGIFAKYMTRTKYKNYY